MIYLYLTICFSWTLFKFLSIDRKDKSLLMKIGYLLFDFCLYPVSYVFYTYNETLKMYNYNGKERKEKK